MHDGFKANDDGETIDKEPIEMDPKDKPGEKTLAHLLEQRFFGDALGS